MKKAPKAKTKQPNRIKVLLAERDLTSRDLAKMIGVSGPHMSRLENGQTPLSLEWIEKITAALDVSSHEIIGLPFDRKFTKTCDDALLGSAIGWLLEAAEQYKVKLSREDLSKWASYIYNGALEQELNHKQTRYVATTIIKAMRVAKK